MNKIIEDGFLNIAGSRVAYSRYGHGSPVALIHGIPTSRHLWRNVTPFLTESGYEVIAIDLLGYGDSGKPTDADLGIKAQSEIVFEMLSALGWECGTIVGHDIGGGIAQLLAINHPGMVDHLVLIDSILYDSFPEPGISRLKDPIWDGILGAPDFDLRTGFAKAFHRGMFHTERITPEFIDAYERPFHGIEGRHAYLRAARALRTEELSSCMERIEKLALPTLIIWGRKDTYQPLQLGERLARKMVNAQITIIEEAGHFLPEDAPEALAACITEFSTHREELH
ncbi:alpha/beta hydrolase [Salmonella enterica]|nr:alpha/beta hydrolase [Salmonella enterica]EAW9909093.1 alpha/beta hydrolase [Salmonella enterica]